MREPGPGKGHPRKKMRMIEGEGWVPAKDLEAKEGKGSNKDPGKNNAKKNGGSVAGSQPMEKGESRDAEGEDDDDNIAAGEKTNGLQKMKGKDVGKKFNGVETSQITNEAGMISPESLEAT